MLSDDELRALADALQQDIDELRLLASGELTAADEAWFAMHDKAIACLLACADAQPVGMLTVATFRGHLENRDFDYTGDLPDGNYPLYTHPAPVAPQAEPCIGNDPACPCQDGDPCHYRDTETTKAWPIPQVDQKREPWSGYEAGHRAGYALALTERRTDDCTFETDTPDEHTHIEEVRALLRGDTGLKEQAKPPRQAGQEISLGALMREQRQSRIVAGAYPDGNPNAGAMMAQTPQAGPQREPLSDDEINKLAWKQNLWTDGMIEFSFVALAREVERAHGIGGSDERR